jgi:TM2 domain-containing membrane protein YozV
MQETVGAGFCAQCGARLHAGAKFCAKCGAASAVADNSGARQPLGGNGPASTSGPMRTARPLPAQPQMVIIRSEKSAGLAAVLSFLIPGLGQIYNRQIGKGILFFVFVGISCLLILAVIGFLTTPVLWIWNIVDAYKSSENLNRQAASY